MNITGETVRAISRNRGRVDLCNVIAAYITEQGQQYHLDTPLRIQHFLGQICIESGWMTRL